jgi:hypothetical protein
MNFDFDALPESEKGWKKPGAHVADWFNYGFDETTWRAYVTKQKRMRKEDGWASNPFAVCTLLLARDSSRCTLIPDLVTTTGFRTWEYRASMGRTASRPERCHDGDYYGKFLGVPKQ